MFKAFNMVKVRLPKYLCFEKLWCILFIRICHTTLWDRVYYEWQNMASQYRQVCDKQNQCNHKAQEITFNVMFIYIILLNYLGRI